jgi:AraC family transcriptional regulator of adaptative response/methylated-DNA-[protein]-cysteine methyltransferase
VSRMRPYRKPHEVLQMTVSNNPVAGAAEIQFAIGHSSLGAMLVAGSDQGICAILIGDDPDALVRDLQERFQSANLLRGGADFEQLVARIVAFVEAPKLGLELSLDVRGTQFQRRVWKALKEIPVGSTASYTDVAKQIGAPNSVRAVAQACGANPIAVAIPCHRVVRNDGALSGYRWGVERKRALLEREAAS